MSSKFKVQGSSFDFKKLKIFCLLPFAFCLFSCGSVPNLEKPECTDARNTVREFYSIHFDNDMRPSKEYWKIRESFLTPGFSTFVSKQLTDKRDFFTLEEDFPKAFRVGGCEVLEPNRKTNIEILLFWKDDHRSEQKQIVVTAVKENGRWLIDSTGGK